MSAKKIILHIIYNLGRGGAETMLVRVLKDLKDYHNIVLTLEGTNHFGEDLECDEYICIHKPSLFSLPTAAIQINKLIKNRNVAIVHSHLPVSNFAARLGTPKNIPLFTTIHTSIASAVDYKKMYLRTLDKLTYNFKKSTIIGVSQVALDDYFSVLKIKPYKALLLHTFVDIDRYKQKAQPYNAGKFKIITIGSLRTPKNYIYLLEAFISLKSEDIELHIYGDGPLYNELDEMINLHQLPVILKGQVNNLNEVLPNYHLFVMSSLYEGFSLSVLEAMAVRLPLLLSNISSFQEQCMDSAVYFSLTDPNDFVAKLKSLRSNQVQQAYMAARAYDIMYQNYTLTHHMGQLNDIYKIGLKEA